MLSKLATPGWQRPPPRVQLIAAYKRKGARQIATVSLSQEQQVNNNILHLDAASAGAGAGGGGSAVRCGREKEEEKTADGKGGGDPEVRKKRETEAMEQLLKRALDLACYDRPVFRRGKGIYKFGDEFARIKHIPESQSLFASADDKSFMPFDMFIRSHLRANVNTNDHAINSAVYPHKQPTPKQPEVPLMNMMLKTTLRGVSPWPLLSSKWDWSPQPQTQMQLQPSLSLFAGGLNPQRRNEFPTHTPISLMKPSPRGTNMTTVITTPPTSGVLGGIPAAPGGITSTAVHQE